MKLYRRTDLYDQPEVTTEEAAINSEIAKQLSARGKRVSFNKPVRPRSEKKGLFPVSRSTFDKWVQDGLFPKPTVRIGRTAFWSEDVIKRMLNNPPSRGRSTPWQPRS